MISILIACTSNVYYILGNQAIKLWYAEKNAAFELWSDRFGNYEVGNGLINNNLYYVNELNKNYSIWKNHIGYWCNGLSSERNSDELFYDLYSDSDDICESNWFYIDANNEWQDAKNGIVIQCQSGNLCLKHL